MPLELPDGWRDQLPDDIKADGALDTLTSIDQMAAMVVNARKYATNSIRIPGEDATPEKRTEFLADLQQKVPDLVYVGEGADLSKVYNRMGRPKESTDYKLGDIPDPLKDNFATLAGKAHELGLSEKQLLGLKDTIVGDYTINVNKQALALEESTAEIKKEYGEATPEKLKAASEFAKQLGFDDAFANAINTGVVGLENMKAFDKLMDGFESSGPRIGDEQGATFTHLTPGEAEAKISEMLNNKDHDYWATSGPAHDEAVKKMVELTRAADVGKPMTDSEKFRESQMGG